VITLVGFAVLFASWCMDVQPRLESRGLLGLPPTAVLAAASPWIATPTNERRWQTSHNQTLWGRPRTLGEEFRFRMVSPRESVVGRVWAGGVLMALGVEPRQRDKSPWAVSEGAYALRVLTEGDGRLHAYKAEDAARALRGIELRAADGMNDRTSVDVRMIDVGPLVLLARRYDDLDASVSIELDGVQIPVDARLGDAEMLAAKNEVKASLNATEMAWLTHRWKLPMMIEPALPTEITARFELRGRDAELVIDQALVLQVLESHMSHGGSFDHGFRRYRAKSR